MKTKEEIIQSLYGISINSDKRVPMGKDECIRCMQEYADQEKQALKEMVLSEIAHLSELQTTDDLTPFGSGKLSALKAVLDFIDKKA